ncbi:MAG: NADP-dependent oxidoreductase, partial [Actinomycetota bacterium]|nr:NADP-dependent oxidoreductase [Actinomycetota bacterium]
AGLPMPLGLEASGVVIAVGPGAEGPAGEIHAGDEVIAYQARGTYAARVIVPGSSVVPKPPNVSFEAAGGLMLAGTTAVHALVATEIAAGDTIVLHGASGGVGLMVVQLAVALGARVIGTAGEGSHAELRALGAEPVVYGDGLVDRIRALAPEEIDAAIDGVGTDEAVDSSLELVADRSRIATIVASPRAHDLGVKALGSAPGADPGTDIRSAARLELVRQAEKGTIKVRVAASYPLADAAEAHRHLASGHAHGKIVLIP